MMFRVVSRNLQRLSRNTSVLPIVQAQALKIHTAVSLCSSQKSWNLGKINHIAMVTPDIDKSSAFFKDVLGGNVTEKQDLPNHGVTTAFVNLGDTKVELVQPLGADSPINSFLKKNKNGGMHHLCIEVDNITKAMEDLKAKNIHFLNPKPKPGAHGKPVIFLDPRDCNGVLLELEET